MYNLWGFKLPPTVTASLWSSFLPWGRPSGSILILQWNCRPSLLLFLFSVLSSSIVAPLHLFLLSRFAAVLQGPWATERKTLWEGFYIIFSYFSLSLSLFLCLFMTLMFWSLPEGVTRQIIYLLCPVRLQRFILLLFVLTHLTLCFTKIYTAGFISHSLHSKIHDTPT